MDSKIGKVILYYREKYNVSAVALCSGICTPATLSKLEAGKCSLDVLTMEYLLSRLGLGLERYELIANHKDADMLTRQEGIEKCISCKKYDLAEKKVEEYLQIYGDKNNVHRQYGLCRMADILECKKSDIGNIVKLLEEASSCTRGEVQKNRSVIGKEKFVIPLLSISEITIDIRIAEYKLTMQEETEAGELLINLEKHVDCHFDVEGKYKIYPRITYLLSKLYYSQADLDKARRYCLKGLERNKDSRRLDYRAELWELKGRIQEKISKNNGMWEHKKIECMDAYIMAYYLYDVMEKTENAEAILGHIQEETGWQGTEWDLL